MNKPRAFERFKRGILVCGCFGLALLATVGGAQAQNPNVCDEPGDIPDVIVGELHEIIRHGQSSGITAYSVGTYSCNIGTCWLDWFQESQRHPVIAGTMFRVKDGKLEQIGQSWLKHGFFALSDNLCHTDCIGTSGTHLGVHCADPYSAGLNGQQSNLGPKWEVNPATGLFVFPFSTRGQTGNTIYKRLQVHNTDLEPDLNPGATYYVEGMYLFPDDAPLPDDVPDANMDGFDDFDLIDNSGNNASYRQIGISETTPGVYNVFFNGATQRQKSVVFAWRSTDPGVIIKEVVVPGDGRYWVASKATDLGNGLWNYEYAIQNATSHRAVQSFSVPIPFGANISNIGFHDVDYHSEVTDGSGSYYDPTDWTNNGGEGFEVRWSTLTVDENARANALRWGTLYNFRFDADVPPGGLGTATMDMFLPGNPASVGAPVVAPSICDSDGVCDPGEDCTNCAADCSNQGAGGGCCGDDVCDPGENSCICLRDCGPPPTVEFFCSDGLDEDCDGHGDCADFDCCSDGACAGPDSDMDGFETCDCDDTNNQVWSYPGETEDLLLAHDVPSGATTIVWTAPLQPGGNAVTYEVLRTSNPRNFLTSTVCIADGDPSDTTATDSVSPDLESPYNYLVRAVNACPGGGEGLLHRTSSSLPVEGRSCP